MDEGTPRFRYDARRRLIELTAHAARLARVPRALTAHAARLVVVPGKIVNVVLR